MVEKKEKKQEVAKKNQKNICVKIFRCCIVLFPFNDKEKGKAKVKNCNRCFDSDSEVTKPKNLRLTTNVKI